MSRIGLISTLLFSIPCILLAQQIRATVNLETTRMDREKETRLEDLPYKLEQYINNNDRSPNEWNTDININIDMVLMDVSISGAEVYNCPNFLINNGYDFQMSDRRWTFLYDSSLDLVYNEFNPDSFTGFIEFYMNMALGFEYDKWGEFAGTPYFEKANNIARQGNFDQARLREGWAIRRDLAESMLSEDHKSFRKMMYTFYRGLSAADNDMQAARKYVSDAIDELDHILYNDPDHQLATTFLNVHYMEMTEIFKDAMDKGPVRKLLLIDPDHATHYKEILND